jgi:hypothetical protein
MSEPRRFLDDERATPLARTLLRSAEGDGLDATRADAVARALGLGGAASAALATPAEAPAPKRTPLSGAAKWAVIAGLAGVVVASATLFVRSSERVASSPSLAPVTTAIATALTPAPPVVAPTPPTPETPEAVSVALLPEAPPEPAPRATTRAPASAAPSADDLSAEIRALERVRVAIAEHRVADARADLTSYEGSFPKKLLGKEARVLEIETLFAEGRRAEGEASARAFLATSADSPYAARVRSLLGSAEPQ